MTTPKDHECRHGEVIHKLRRESVMIRLGMHALLDHFGLPRVTQEQVDDVLDRE